MNKKALVILEASERHTSAIISTGDKVLATPNGSDYLTAYVYSIEDSAIVFMSAKSGCLFDCERGLAEETTVLLERYEDTQRAQTINTILEMIA